MNLSNSTICIPGGNSGLGLELVKIMAKVCKKIFVLDKDTECTEITNLKNVDYYKIDLSHQKIGNFNEKVDILVINSGLMKSELKTFKETPFIEIEKLISSNIRSNLRLFKDFDPKKVVIINSIISSKDLEYKAIQSACISFFKTFNESLQKEEVNTTIVYLYKDAKYQEAANNIVYAINNDIEEVYVPLICSTTENLKGFLPEVAMDAIVDNCASVSDTVNNGVTKISAAIPEISQKISSGVNSFMNLFSDTKQSTSETTLKSKKSSETKNQNSKSCDYNIPKPKVVKEIKGSSSKSKQPSISKSKQPSISKSSTEEVKVLKPVLKGNFSEARMLHEKRMIEALKLKIKEEKIPESIQQRMFQQLYIDVSHHAEEDLCFLNSLPLNELKKIIIEPQDLSKLSNEIIQIMTDLKEILDNRGISSIELDMLYPLLINIPSEASEVIILKRFYANDLQSTTLEQQRRILDLFKSFHSKIIK